jgi:hypothetical protein
MGWLRSQSDAINARLDQRIVEVKTLAGAASVLEIDDFKILICDRFEVLENALLKWVIKHGDKHLVGSKDRSVKLAHGTIGFRQVPLSVTVPKKTDAAVVESIDTLLGGVLKKLRGGIQRLSKAFGLMICELVSIEFTVNTSAIKSAIKEKRYTADAARDLGLDVVEPWDRAVYTLPEVDLSKIS